MRSAPAEPTERGGEMGKQKAWTTRTTRHPQGEAFNWSHVSVLVHLRPETEVVVIERREFDALLERARLREGK